MDDGEAEAEFRRYSAEVDYRIHQIQTDRTERRLAYVQALYPNTLTAKAAFQEAAGVAVVALLFLVLPVLGLMWLDQPDGFDDPQWVWITYAAGVVVVGIVQCSRVYQAARAQFDVIQRTWARFNADGWPPLTEIEQAAHKETTPERLLELANSTNLDVLIVVGERPDLPAAGLELLAQHADRLVRLRAAWHPKTPTATRARLLDDPDDGVRDAARKHS